MDILFDCKLYKMKVVFIFFNQKAKNRQGILSFCLTFASSIAINTMYSPVNG